MSRQNAKQLLERRVRPFILRTIEVNLKLFDRLLAVQKCLTNIVTNVLHHGRVMVWVIPAPVRSTLVVIVQNPLKTFDILAEHLWQRFLAVRGVTIDVHFGAVVELFGFFRVFAVH